MFDDVLLEHGRLPHVLPLAVKLDFFCWTSTGDHSKIFLLFELCCGTPPSCLKVMGWWVVGAGGLEQFCVSPRPLGFGFGTKGFGAKGLGPGLDNIKMPCCLKCSQLYKSDLPKKILAAKKQL